MSTWTAVIFVFLVFYIGTATSVFRYRINAPVVIVFCWAPALYLSGLGVTFTSTVYRHLSSQKLFLCYTIICIAFICIFVGYLLGCRNKQVPDKNFVLTRQRMNLHLLFCSVFSLYVYIILQSNVMLTLTTKMLAEEVLEARNDLHLGTINHLTLGLNFLAANYLVMFGQSKRKVYLVPMLLVFLAHAATLQKSMVIGYILQMFFVYVFGMTHPNFRRRLKVFRLAAVVMLGLGLSLILLWTNEIRGISLNQVTNLHPINEQLFIYLGGPAILNLAATLNGILPSVDLSGLLPFQSIAWITGGREFFSVTRYLEGINNGTAIMYWWADMGLLGVILHSTILGFVVGMLQLRAKNNMMMLYFCAMSYQFLAMSIFTEALYQPTTVLIIINVFALQIFLNLRMWPASEKQSTTRKYGSLLNEANDDRT
jgi:oligosaccharide repeat unit polymerase